MNSKVFLMVFFCLAIRVFGGHEAGGGGVLVCGPKDRVVALDIYEAREIYKLEVDYGPDNLKAMERVKWVLNRFAKIDGGRATRYLRDAQEFAKIAIFKPGIILGDITDSMHSYIPDHCRVIQVVSQSRNSFPPRPIYIVASDLWNRLDEISKAALILHEIVYKEGIENGHEHSLKSRYFHELIAAAKWDALGKTDEDKVDFLKNKMGFSTYYKSGIPIEISADNLSPYINENHSVVSGRMSTDGDNTLEYSYGTHRFSVVAGRYVIFYDDTDLIEWISTSVMGPSPILLGFKSIVQRGSAGWRFNQKKEIVRYGNQGSEISQTTVQGKPLTINNMTYDSSKKQVCIYYGGDEPVKLLTTDGSYTTIISKQPFKIDEKDRVVDTHCPL